MAKVIMPLMSAEASGRLASAIVYFTWKGINVVRQFTIPGNPRVVDQKIIRQKLAACGKNCRYIETPKIGLLDGSEMYQLIKAVMPAGQIWNAYLVKKIMADMANDFNFTTLQAAHTALGATVATIWQTSAASLGFEALTGPQYATEISPSLQFFMGGYGASVMNLCSAQYDFSDHPSNWTDAKVIAFATHYSTAA